MNAYQADARARLIGNWVSQSNVLAEPDIHVSAPDDDRGALLLNDLLFLRHPLHNELWRAPGVGRFAFWVEQTLWSLTAEFAVWMPYCRPGVAQLLDPPAPPSMCLTRTELTARLQQSSYLLSFEFREHQIDGQPRSVCRVWVGVGHEVTLWDHDGAFDLCDLI